MSALWPTPKAAFAGEAYKVPRHPASVMLRLDGNEGAPPESEELAVLGQLQGEDVRRYPSASALETSIAETLGVDSAQVLVTAGADDALLRMCRAFLSPGKNLVFPTPGFVMIPRFVSWSDGSCRKVDWNQPSFPLNNVVEACCEDTTIVCVTSPNNPTGFVVRPEELKALSSRLPGTLLMVDAAYGEFAEEDLTSTALTLPNALVFRTFSKAYGLAGLRVGYVVGPAPLVAILRRAGVPYPVGTPSLRMAEAVLKRPDLLEDRVTSSRSARNTLENSLRDLGLKVDASQGNFVFARGLDGQWWRDAFAGLRIGVRAWPGNEELADAIRVSVTGCPAELEQVTQAAQTIANPEALLWDMDGVLVDVSESYRQAIEETVRFFGGQVSGGDIEAVKQAGDANNDWVVSQRLLAAQSIDISLDAIQEKFDDLVWGESGGSPLYLKEKFIGTLKTLRRVAGNIPCAVVTGRPRRDADSVLERFQLRDLFPVVICMEDAPAKPSPEPVKRALQQLGVQRAWMFGDTPDDMVAAREAGVLPLGVLAPGTATEKTKQALMTAGAARVGITWEDWVERWS